MAGVFDEILGSIPEADRAVLAKYPQLKERVEQLDANVDQWEAWRAAHWDSDKRMTKSEVAALERIEELQSAVGADMTFDQISAELKKQGYVTAADIPSAVAPVIQTHAEQTQKALNQMSLGYEHIYGSTAHLPVQHKDEFGEVFKLNDLFKYMAENKVQDPQTAYDQMVAPKRDAAQQKAKEAQERAHQEELERVRAEEREKVKREMSMGPQGSLPVDQGGTPAAMGHLQQRVMDRNKPAEADKPPVLPGAKLGEGVLARAGYDALVASRQAGSN